jgi:hypothetical protein
MFHGDGVLLDVLARARFIHHLPPSGSWIRAPMVPHRAGVCGEA